MLWAAPAEEVAERARAGERGLDRDHLLDMGALFGLGHGVIVDPAIAVAGDFPVGLHHRYDRVRVAGERHGNAEDRDGHRALGEQAMQAPEADAAAELVHRFDRQRALADAGLDEAELGEQRLRARIAVEHAVLGALLVVDDELDGDARVARPAGMGPVAAIAHHVAGIGGVAHGASRRSPAADPLRARSARARAIGPTPAPEAPRS